MPWLLKMTLLVAGIKAAVDLYLGWRVSNAVDLLNPHSGPFWSWLIVGFFFLFYLLPVSGLIQHLTLGDVDLMNYPKPIVYLFWCGFAFSFQVLAWIVVLDLLKLLVNHGVGINAPFVDQGYGVLVVGLSLLILIFTATKMYLDTNRIETETLEYDVSQLPGELEGFRIVHISDIQADRYTGEREIERYIQKVNEQKPDLVVFTGDLISYGTRYIDMAARELARVDARYGIYFVVGDHDFWAGVENVKKALRRHNITVLEGENVLVGPEDASIRLTGLTNVYSRTAPVSEIEQLTRDSTGSAIQILASHQVSDPIVEHAQANSYEIILAGHTHGGQVRVPVFFRRVSASNFETEYVQGPYWIGDMLLNVNNGLGFTLAPVRYNARPNISVIELREKQDQE